MRISTAVLAKCKCFNVHFQNMYYGNMAVIIINNNVIICILTKIDLGEGEKLTTVHIYIYCVTPLVTQNCRTLCGKNWN